MPVLSPMTEVRISFLLNILTVLFDPLAFYGLKCPEAGLWSDSLTILALPFG